jgi:hypothetical protein
LFPFSCSLLAAALVSLVLAGNRVLSVRSSTPEPQVSVSPQTPPPPVAESSAPPAPSEEGTNPTVEPGKVRWHSSFADAQSAAARSGKPVLLFHMMGQLDRQFC